jgi:hypothetical protein
MPEQICEYGRVSGVVPRAGQFKISQNYKISSFYHFDEGSALHLQSVDAHKDLAREDPAIAHLASHVPFNELPIMLEEEEGNLVTLKFCSDLHGNHSLSLERSQHVVPALEPYLRLTILPYD